MYRLINAEFIYLCSIRIFKKRIALLHGPIFVTSCTVNYNKICVSSISALVHSDVTFIFVYHNDAAHSFARKKWEIEFSLLYGFSECIYRFFWFSRFNVKENPSLEVNVNSCRILTSECCCVYMALSRSSAVEM